jgi:hypothetical protein
MSEIYKQYHPKGLEVVMAAVNTDPKVDDFVRRFNLPFPVGMGDGDKARGFFELSLTRPIYVPWFVIIDRKGVIRVQYTGSDAHFFEGGIAKVQQAIEPILAERATTAPKKAAPVAKK